jgi:AmmeMemoRadiSam system protein B
MLRQPAVAGTFYPADPLELARQIDEYSRPPDNAAKQRAVACIVPHAGYMYSGHVAGAVYASLNIPDRCILAGPRHFPGGQPMAILTEGSWQTPLGQAQIDAELAIKLAHTCPLLREDPVAHEREHSLEVQLPFLQRLAPDSTFVPVVLATDRFPIFEQLGKALAQVIWGARGPVLLIASTDLNHYESDDATRVKDKQAIEQILALDPRGLYHTVRNQGITMCGYGATVAVLVAARQLGAQQAQLIRYATSADAGGDRSRVVGYAGIVIR